VIADGCDKDVRITSTECVETNVRVEMDPVPGPTGLSSGI